MAKVYRLHEGQDGTGWFTSTPITKDQLKTIKTVGKDVATSIPSPFARVDLVKSAFRWVADNDIDGDTAHHKLVSYSLDVAQLFYESQNNRSKIQIVAWNPKDRFKNLAENGNSRHSKFAHTLGLFWKQDSVPANQIGNEVLYNFESVNRLYFLLNKENNNVIGGTSPATLFFAAPDVEKTTANLNIKIGHHKLFDDEYAPLHTRESSFIEYIYILAKQPNFANYFPEVFAYLEEVRVKYLSSAIREKVSNFGVEEINNLTSCPVLDNENDTCEILGIPLGIHNENGDEIEKQSDFVINSDFHPLGTKPLILPYHKFSDKWSYTKKDIIWDEKTEIPYKNTLSPKDSKLPILENPYYWLTIGNFFEDKIIELPYPIDDTKFKTCGSKNHLLPLTSTFFKYFSTEKVSEYFKIKEKSGGLIVAELKIPVKGGNITFKKNYSVADKNIEKLEVHLAIFPFLKSDTVKLPYNIGLLDDRLEKTDKLSVSCLIKGKEIELKSPITRNPGEGGELKSVYYKSEKQFDLLKLGIKSAKGFVIPIFKHCAGNSEINFAIDFGTTNTHIEYQYGDRDSVSFDNTNVSPLWQSLLKRTETGIDPEYFENEVTFEIEMLPYSFSNNDEQLQFPLRTALVHNKGVDFNQNIDIFSETNNYLLLEKVPIRSNYLDLHTDIKWSNYADTLDEKKVEKYIEFLARLVYYKTLLLGGDILKTTIIWFYPVSMDSEELNVFFKVWKDVYENIFHQPATDNNIKGIPESIAPYFYYNKPGLCLSIDIGGGSSDIAVFDKSEDSPELISSFKFAGNAIFGDGYASGRHSSNSDKNGFVNMFKEDAVKAVEKDPEKKAILDSILKTRKNSADFSSYLFSLEQDKSNSFSYSRLLGKDKKLKLSILVYYGAIAYYSANLLKNSGIGVPKHILLSGTASKTASIIDPTEDFSFLSQMFKFIFEKVYGNKLDDNISIELSDIPKALTCKGALKAGIKESIKNPPIKFWLGGNNNNNEWGSTFDKMKDVQITPKYGQLNETSKTEIEESIKDFYSTLDDYIKTIRLEEKIEPSAYKLFQDIRDSDIKEFLMKGIKAYYKQDDYHIEESLFFYPLIGILNKLSYSLSEN